MSSKSLAASFFILETLLAKLRMVSRPNVGIMRKLVTGRYSASRGEEYEEMRPFIKFVDSVQANLVQETNQMGESGFPDTQLNFM
jgi:hypothetical protein